MKARITAVVAATGFIGALAIVNALRYPDRSAAGTFLEYPL